MIGNFLRGDVSRSSSQSQSFYYSLGSSDSDEKFPHTSKESNTLPAALQNRRKVWICGSLILVFVLSAAIFGSKYLLKAGKGGMESFVPTLQTHGVVFDLQELFASPPSEKSNAAWDSLIPEGHGYVLVPDASKRYGLEPGISTDEGTDRYSVSVYHQLHCLGMIRILFYEMVAVGNQTVPHRFYHGTDKDNHDPTPFPDHVNHCFDYIRQSLMCSGDMTIEHSREPPLGEKRVDTDGWGVEHQCKDWNAMVGWTLDHKAKHNLSGILG